MFVVYNDLNNKCGPYTSSNLFHDIPLRFFTCWNHTWYAQLNLSHAIPSINMDIFMGNLARQAVALPKGSHQPIFHRLSPLGATAFQRSQRSQRSQRLRAEVFMFIFQFRSQALKFQLLTPLRCAKAAKGQVTWEWFMAETVMVITPRQSGFLTMAISLWVYGQDLLYESKPCLGHMICQHWHKGF